MLGHLQLPQDAVAANYQLRLADCRMYLGKRLFEIPHEIHTPRAPQNKTLLDSTEEGQTTVGVDLLNRADIVRAIDDDHYRLLRKARGVKTLHVGPHESSVALGRRPAVDLTDDPMFGIRRCDHDPLVRGNKVLRLEYPKRNLCSDQGQGGAIGVEATVRIYPCFPKAQVITGGASDQRKPSEGILQGLRDRFFAYGQPIDQQECETVARVS